MRKSVLVLMLAAFVLLGMSTICSANSYREEKNAVVVELLPSAVFRVKLENGDIVLAHISGKMEKNFVKIRIGSKVLVEVSPYDQNRGRIVYLF